MRALVRINDPSDHGGKMITGTSKFTINGINGCVSGDIHSCPRKGHGNTAVNASSTVSSNGKSILHVGDTAGCGAKITSGSENTNGN